MLIDKTVMNTYVRREQRHICTPRLPTVIDSVLDLVLPNIDWGIYNAMVAAGKVYQRYLWIKVDTLCL